MRDYRRLFRLSFGRRAELERELDDEIRTHIELRTEELVADGMSAAAARKEAERRFGDPVSARRALVASARRREARVHGRDMMENVRRDIRLAFRQIRRSPGYSLVSISIFSVGIALTTVMFTVFDNVLLRPLPYPDAERLVSLQSVGESGGPYDYVSMANWYDWRDRSTTLEATALARQDRLSVSESDEAFRVTGASVGGDFFDVFRPAMIAGRALALDDGQESRRVAVVSSGFASRRFGSAALATGRPLTITGTVYEIVGVVAAEQAFPDGTEIWIPLRIRPESGALRNNINYQGFGLLRTGTEIGRADEELDAVARGISESDPEGAVHSFGVAVRPLQDVIVSGSADALWMLMVAVAGVLLAACANLAGLGLARVRRRYPEIALRLALGAGRARVVRQIMTEYLVLSVVGGLAGVALSWLAAGLVFDRIGLTIPRAASVSMDLRVLAFAVGLSVLSGLLAGVVPALRASARAGVSRERGRIQGGSGLPGGLLVGTEVALALALLVGGGLLLRSFQSIVARDLGFDAEGVVVAEVQLTGPDYADESRAVEFWRSLLSELNDTPGVTEAAVANWIPTGTGGTSFIEFPDRPDPDFGGGYRVVSDRYFGALGITVLEGRAFDASDAVGTARVTLVNRAMADRAWPDQSAIGQLIRAPSMEDWMYGGDAPWLTVVGVVDDVRHYGHEADPNPELYVSYRQVPNWSTAMNVVLRGPAGTTATLSSLVRDAVRSADPSLAVEVRTLDERVSGLLRERLVTMRLLTGFALVALLLMGLGIYGLVAQAAAQRTREIAIRAALGAQRSGLLRLMLLGAGRVIVGGALAGLLAAYAVSGLMGSLVVDVPTTDLPTYVGAALLLGVVGMLAAFVPSARAARLDPIEALRRE